MGSIASLPQKVESFQLAQLRSGKNQRDMQLALAVARTRDMVYFISGGLSGMASLSLLATLMGKRPPIAIIPITAVTTVLAYQVDLAWGNKLNRIYNEALRIREEPGWWFNEMVDLPPTMRGAYKRWKQENAGEKDWAKYE